MMMMMTTVVSNFGAKKDAVHYYGLSHSGLQRCLYLPPNLRSSSFKIYEVWKRAGLRSMLFQRRDLGITKIIHEHNITGGCPWRDRWWRWFLPPLSIYISVPATTASYPGMSHAILRSNMWPHRQCAAPGASDCHRLRIKSCCTFQLTASK